MDLFGCIENHQLSDGSYRKKIVVSSRLQSEVPVVLVELW